MYDPLHMWTYRDGIVAFADPEPDTGATGSTLAVAGYTVEARDGPIGSIDEATAEAGDSWVVVDTGPWIFGRRVVIPAGSVERIDHAGESVRVGLTRDQIRHAPEAHPEHGVDAEYRERLARWYAGRERDTAEPGPGAWQHDVDARLR